MANRLLSFLVFFCLALAGCATQNGIVRFSERGKTYVITSCLTGRIAPAESVTLVFKGSGRIKNATFVGNNTVIVAEGTNTIFENCTFDGTFCKSELYATNFGCSDNLSKKSFKWTFGSGSGKTIANTYRYVSENSVNNKAGLDMIAQFCSRSSDVAINFNGSFYTPVADNDGIRGTNVITIKDATRLKLTGGTLIQGLVFFNCLNVHVKSMNFIGQHVVHDFPIVYGDNYDFSKTEKNGLTTKNCYNIVANQYGACGLAPEGIYIKVDQGRESRDFLVEDCRFEMRANGVITGIKGRTNNIHHITVRNCKFSHIYFQPVGFHGSFNVVDGIESEYCMQGFDLSSGTNNSMVCNSCFKDCAVGPKQETRVTNDNGHYDSYGNQIENCYYQINEKFRTVGIKRQIFYASEGKPGDTFLMRNMTFDVDVTTPIEGIESRANKLKISNLNLILNLPSNQVMSFLFAPNGNSAYTPNILVDSANIVCNANLDVFAKSSTAKLNMQINNLSLKGNGRISDVAFRALNSLYISNCHFSLPCNYFTQLTPDVTVTNSNIENISRIAFYPANKGADNYTFNVSNTKVTAGVSVFWVSNCNRFTINATENTLQANAILSFDKNIKSVNLDITKNVMEIRGKTMFTGINNTPSKSVAKIENNSIKMPSGSTIFDKQSKSFNAAIVRSKNKIR